MTVAQAANAAAVGQQPRGLRVLCLAEMWERFSYYGMRALLVYYLVDGLHWPVGQATALYGLYTGAVYLTPILGGYLTDRLLGPESAIRLGAIMMAAGHCSLAVPHKAVFFAGLLLVSLGCGLFKPNVSLLLGSLYAPGDPRRDAGFGWFYLGINVGALLAPLVCGTLGQTWGWHYGFAAAGAGMAMAWGSFVWLWPQVRHEVVVPRLPPAGERTPAPPAHLAERWLLLGVLGLVGNVVFWAAFEQAGSSVALFVARGGDLHLPHTGLQVPASWYQSFNPIAIVVLTPLMAFVWRALAASRRSPQAPLKFAVGLLLLAASFVLLSLLGRMADLGSKVPLLWFLLPTLLATASELCVSPVGLALASQIAPPGQASLTMGLWFASMALGNLLAGLFAGHYANVSHALFFAEPAMFCALAGLLLLLLVPLLTRRLNLLGAREGGK